MRAAWTIAKREVRSYFSSPVAYVVLLAWIYVSGLSFYTMVYWFAGNPSTGGSDNPLTLFFGGTVLFWLPLLVFAPVMTMRLFAQERTSGTLEALLTSPVGEVAIVTGKLMAAMVFWITLWVPSLLYVWIVSRYGDVDLGTVASSYLGILGIGFFYMSWGMLMSALAPSQIVAAILTFLVLGLLFTAGIMQFVVYDDFREVLGYVSVWSHMSDFAKGIVDSRWLSFYATMTALAFYLTVRAVSWRRVRG
ncbi:MAG: ABC transporter permease subunit [Myxococcales bacterium]|nr:ABC transporter permease subunit [Myxococcales bacterium]